MDANDRRSQWLLEPAVTYLNHGAYGACPRPVLAAQAEWRERMERQPVRFLGGEVERELDRSRASLAEFMGAQADDLAFVPNATTGVNTVLRSLALAAGDELLVTDHEYNACLNAVSEATQISGARLVICRVPFPLSSPDEVVEAVLAAVTPRTRLAVISHVTSPTALVWPIERIVAALAERGVDTLVDGAHAPGMVPLALDALGAAYYAGNAHKWLCAPKGAGFLYVRPDRQALVRPLVVSHGANSPRTDRSRFRLEFDWTGTADLSAYLAIPAALEFLARLLPGGWPAVMAANRRLALAARQALLDVLGAEAPAPAEMIGAMAAVALPVELGPPPPSMPADAPHGATYPPDPLHDALLERFRIEVPVYAWPHAPAVDRPRLRLLRVSAQLYNQPADYEALAAALVDLRDRPGADALE
jgi:isopenicillin-N epimerase